MKNRKRWALSLILAMILLSSPLAKATAEIDDVAPDDLPEPTLSDPPAPNADDETAETEETSDTETAATADDAEVAKAETTNTTEMANESTQAEESTEAESPVTQIASDETATVTNSAEATTATDAVENAEAVASLGDSENIAMEAPSDATTEVSSQEVAAEAEAGEVDPATAEVAAIENAEPEITAEEAADIEEMVDEWLEVRTNATVMSAISATIPTTYDEAYDRMAALETEYPEGKDWTNFTPYGKDGPLADTYWWSGGKIKGASGGVGCAAFAFILSDHAFGDLPARTLDHGTFSYDDVKVGDILRVNDSHFVVVMQKSAAGVTVAEANYNKSVHWGRALSVDDVMASNFIVTRYPENFVPADSEDVDTIVQSGKEDLLDWSLTKGGVLTVSGTGALPDYSPNDSLMPSWHSFNDSITSIILQNGITGIGNYAFYQSKALSAYLADTILRIGQSAFRGSNLVAITIPKSVNTIEDDAFRDCKNLTSATIPEGVETIGERAFQGDTALKYVDFPSSTTSVGSGAFASCENLVRVRFAPGTERAIMGDNLFTQCWRLQSVTLPQGLAAITPGMFSSCKSLLALYIPQSVQNLTASGEDSPFMSSGIRLIEFGGTEAEWEAMLQANPYLRATLQGVQVLFNVEFDDPFAPIPGDPGDIKFEETTDPGGNTNPDDPNDPSKPGDNNPDNPDKPNQPDNPDQPVNPNPGTPSEPTEPSRPSRPTTPTQPDTSGNASAKHEADNSSQSQDDYVNLPASTSSETLADGSMATTTIFADGSEELEIQLADTAIAGADRAGTPVFLAIPQVKVATDLRSAPALAIRTGSRNPVKVAIPVAEPTASTVLALMQPDGTAKIIAKSVLQDDHLITTLQNGDKVKIIDNRQTFSDVKPGSQFEAAINFMTARELLTGTAISTFSPDAPMKQVTLLTALAHLDDVAEADVRDWTLEHFHTEITDLDTKLTVGQLFDLLWQYYQGTHPDSASENGDVGTQNGESADRALTWAVNNRLTTQNSELLVNPQREVTRAETAEVLMSFIINISAEF